MDNLRKRLWSLYFFYQNIKRKYIELPINRRICRRKGHKWNFYTVSTGYWSYDIEQAGYCTRCEYDTHGEYNY